jgi:16S rRNA (cytosine967-C5)-methyltransferase
MKISTPQLAAAEAALAHILPMTQPADAVLSRYFRAHPGLGQHDRAFIAETVFGVLRRRYGLEHHTGADTPRRLLLAYLNRIQGVSLRQLEPLLGRGDAQWTDALKARPDSAPASSEQGSRLRDANVRESGAAPSSAGVASVSGVTSPKGAPVPPSDGAPPLHVAAELPQWLIAMLAAELPEDEILTLGRALQQAAPLDLRVNPLLAGRDEVLDQLAADGIAAHPTPYSPLGIRLDENPALNRHPLFTGGKIEVQDEGSQLVCCLLAPKRREMVVDFCAGAGGKTLMLGALMQSQGRLYAYDVSESRLNKFKPRLRRSGLSNVHPQRLNNENDIKVKRLAGKIDRVLVDAPCSGFGTLRRNPDLKWRQSEAGITELTAKQRAILAAAAALVKPGGRLVYATCSFLRAENQDIVAAFLAAHPRFTLLPANEVLRQQHIALDTGEFLRLYPHRHGCDGFFAAVMTRVGG